MKPKSSKRKVNRLVGLGYLDLTLILDLTDEDIINFDIELNNINSINDLEHICKYQLLLEKITLLSNSSIINTLLYINKSSKQKTFIEYNTFNIPKFSENQLFLKEMITYVTEHNFIFINELNISLSPCSVMFVIKRNGTIIREFFLGSKEENKSQITQMNKEDSMAQQNKGYSQTHQNKEDAQTRHNKGEPIVDQNRDYQLHLEHNKESNQHQENKNEGQEDHKEKGKDYENQETKADGSKKEHISINNRKDKDHPNKKSNDNNNEEKRKPIDFPQKIICDFIHFDFIYIDLNQILINTQEICVSNVSLEEINILLQFLTINYPQIKIFISYPNIISNIHLVNIEELNILNSILSYTDIFLFERREAISFLNLINQINDPDFKEEKNKINDKQLEKIFLNAFISKRIRYPKIGVFIDDFQKVLIIEKAGNTVLNNFYPLELYPKVNHTNQKLIEEYKKNIFIHKDLLKAVFLGGFLSKYIVSSGIINSLVAATEITKRILEILRLELEFPSDQEFYLISLKKVPGVNLNIIEKQKEDNFILDCININKSKLGMYNPLQDNNLFSFFSSNVIRKHLKEVGFINTNGFLLDDPNRVIANSPLKVKSSYEIEIEKEKKLLIAIKENEMRNSNVKKNLSVKSKYLHDIGIKELERLVKITELNPKANPLLPSFDLKSARLKPIKGYSSLVTNKSIDKVKMYFLILYRIIRIMKAQFWICQSKEKTRI